jgi:branched-chain amino acid transport system substrate-binding protein
VVSTRNGWRARVACGLLVVAGLLLGVSQGFAQGPVKIGMLAPLSGPFAQIGKDMVAGTELYLDQIGWKVGGRQIELLVEDSEGNPQTGLTKARKLNDQDHVNLLTGVLLSSTAYALQPFVDSNKIPTTYPVSAPDDITQRKPAKWVVRTGWATSQPMHPLGEWAAKTLKLRRVAVIAMDYSFGYESVGGFQQTFEDNGGQIVQKIWTPVNAMDFAPYLAQVRRDVDGVFAVMVGRSALQFVKQYEETGLKGRVPLIGSGTTTDEIVLSSMGDEAVGIVSAQDYSAALDTTANQAFRKAFGAKTGRVTSHYAEKCYTNARWIVEAIKAVDGKVEDRERFLAALRAVQIKDAPRGPLTIDAYANPVSNVYIRKVERINGTLQNTVITTIPSVSQFWKYDPKDYLKMPLYDRNVPPCRYC